jgi:hypothetical protein
LLTTTAISPSPAAVERAQRLARELGARFVRRGTMTLAQLMRREKDDRILVVSETEVKLKPLDGPAAVFHPGMAHIRLQRLLAGEKDPLVAATGARPGDVIVDCTMGLASDAIILSWAAGETGRVTALESEPAVYVLTREGLATYESDLPELNAAMRRIRPEQADHLDWLAGQPDRSADIVYFDPMFRSGIGGSSIDRVREFVNPLPIRPEAVREACRVARRAVVMKERRDSGEWERLGFGRIRASNSGIAYGVIEP